MKKTSSIDKKLRPIEEKDENEIIASPNSQDLQKSTSVIFAGLRSTENFCSSQEIFEAFENCNPKKIFHLNYNHEFTGNNKKTEKNQQNKNKFQTLIHKIASTEERKKLENAKKTKLFNNKSMKLDSSRKSFCFEINLSF